ncbi:PAC2 family protein [Bifidobacterium platyrrhinorum]|uniref:PAC2 family protein n=1 Tax=Bifidobacterium platyrrhinorum TaxID=2661628 RepID=A0A6L9SSM4_9BIFI|nr:PAC2 family protein [Bifidobacterium platyrrhinorum]NEG55494.1 PAC2 family protein [Bifidobacterium platyrrhinorum]
MSEERDQRECVLLAAFEGWNDACQAATNVVRHLVSRYESREIRHISCDGYYDYQVSRPMLCRVTGRPRIIWPQTTFYEITLPTGRRLYAQIAPEPNYRWREYCRQSLHIADELDVDRIVTLGSMFADCPHTRPLPVDVSHDLDEAGRSCDCGANDDEGGYSGPVGIPTVLDDMAREQSFATTSLWASIPQYSGNDDCPQATLNLLRRLGRELGLGFDEGDLEARANEWNAKVTMLLRCSDQLADYVHHLEREWDRAQEARRAASENPRQAEQLVRETEDFLRNL